MLLGGPVSSRALKEIGINESDRIVPVDAAHGEAGKARDLDLAEDALEGRLEKEVKVLVRAA